MPGATSCLVTELPRRRNSGMFKTERIFQVIMIFGKFKNSIPMFSDALYKPLSQNSKIQSQCLVTYCISLCLRTKKLIRRILQDS